MGVMGLLMGRSKTPEATPNAKEGPGIALPKLEAGFRCEAVREGLAELDIRNLEAAGKKAAESHQLPKERQSDPVETGIDKVCRKFGEQFVARATEVLARFKTRLDNEKYEDVKKALEGRLQIEALTENLRQRWNEDAAPLRQKQGGMIKGATGLQKEFENAYKAYDKAKQELRKYRAANNLLEDTVKTKHWTLTWGIILGIFLVETIVNSGFFQDFVKGGLLDGWLLAAAISFSNIVLAICFGRFLLPRVVHGPGFLYRIGYIPFAIFVLGLIVVLNLAAGHFRSMLGVGLPLEPALVEALEQLVTAPLGLADLASASFVFLGLAMAIGAILDAYWCMDHPFPGFGNRFRKQRNAWEDCKIYEEKLENRLAELASEVEEALESDMQVVDKAIEMSNAGEASLNELKKTIESNLNAYNDCYRDLRNTYRGAVKQYLPHGDVLPEYFMQEIVPLPLDAAAISTDAIEELVREYKQHKEPFETLGKTITELVDGPSPKLEAIQMRLLEEFFATAAPYHLLLDLDGLAPGVTLNIDWHHGEKLNKWKYTVVPDNIAYKVVVLRLRISRLHGKRESVKTAKVTVSHSGDSRATDAWPPTNKWGVDWATRHADEIDSEKLFGEPVPA